MGGPMGHGGGGKVPAGAEDEERRGASRGGARDRSGLAEPKGFRITGGEIDLRSFRIADTERLVRWYNEEMLSRGRDPAGMRERLAHRQDQAGAAAGAGPLSLSSALVGGQGAAGERTEPAPAGGAAAPQGAQRPDAAAAHTPQHPPGQAPQSSGSGMEAAAADVQVDALEAYRKQMKKAAREGRLAEVEDLLDCIRQLEGPTVGLYNMAIQCCAQARDLDKAQQYFQKMVELEHLQPDEVTYNSMINVCAAGRSLVHADVWFHRMRDHGFAPTEVTFGTLCKLYAHCGMVDQVADFMRSLEETGVTPNAHFYASLISACGHANPPQTARAERALHDLVAKGMRARSVKSALTVVVGEARAAQLFRNLAKSQWQVGTGGAAASAGQWQQRRPLGGRQEPQQHRRQPRQQH